MSAQHLLENTLKILRQRHEELSSPVLQGQLNTLDQYKHQCGHLQGLREAEHILKSIYQQSFENKSLNSTQETIENDAEL